MPASLHVASFDAADAARVATGMRRLHARLDGTPGLTAGRVFATANFWAPTSGYPTLRRYALLCAFEDDQALADFEASEPAREFADRARESWRLTLEATTVLRAPWRGWSPSTEDAAPLAPDEPVAVMTYGIVRPRYYPTFFIHNRRVIAASMRQEGLIMRLALFDRPLSICTFSLWRSKADVLRFAYGADAPHKTVIRPWRELWGHDNFFARFRILDSSGTCAGRDPLAEVRPAARLASR